MTKRSVLVFLVTFCSFGTPYLNAQEPATVAKTLREFLSAGRALRSCGQAAKIPLRLKRRENPTMGRVFLVLKRQAQTNKSKTQDFSKEEIQKRCDLFEKKTNDVSRPTLKLLAAIVALEKNSAVEDLELLGALDRSLHLMTARARIREFIGRGSYDGMFSDLKDHGPRLRRAFLDLFQDRLEAEDVRDYAATAVAELCPKEERKEYLKAVSAVHMDVDEADHVRISAAVLMAKLGDRRAFDVEIKNHTDVVQRELGKESSLRHYPSLFNSYEVLGQLTLRVGAYERAAGLYTDYLNMLLVLCPYQTQPEVSRRRIARECYDFACILCRLKRLEFANFMLAESLNYGYRDFIWLNKDRDLLALRQTKGFAILMKHWRENKAKPGSLFFNEKRFLELAGRSPQPASRPNK